MVCCAVLDHAMLWETMLWETMLCYAMLCYAMLCYAMLRCAVLCYAVLCCAMDNTNSLALQVCTLVVLCLIILSGWLVNKSHACSLFEMLHTCCYIACILAAA